MKCRTICRLLVSLLFIFAILGGTATQVEASASASVEDTLLQEINAHRAARGAQPLTLNADLNNAASIRAAEITYFFSHTRPDGTPWYTVDHARVYGEALAMGFDRSAGGAQGIVRLWMNSPAHASLLLDGGFRSIGFNACRGGDGHWYWVAVLGF